MSIVQIMMTIIIVTILITVILGVASYGAYWLRRGRQPVQPAEENTGPRFFYRYVPESTGQKNGPVLRPGGSGEEQSPAQNDKPARREEPSELALSALHFRNATAGL